MLGKKIPWISYQVRQFGWQGQSGLLLLLAAIFLLILIQSNIKEAELLRLSINNLQTHKQNQGNKKATSGDVAKRFYAVLPAQKELNQKVAEILYAAENNGLTLTRTDYVERTIPQTMMVQYQIRLPLVGSYPTIREFITDVMNTQPSIALNNVSFHREVLGNDVVDANVEFILYTKTGNY
ncbi:MAG: type 4a pilus biogenesis protein PilO [Methylophilaceae bacterium]